MEEKITSAESRGAAPGLIFQSFLNALQQRSWKGSENSKPVNEGGLLRASSVTLVPEGGPKGSDEAENSRAGLSSTRKRINETLVQLSPKFKDKVERYSPNPLRRLRTFFSSGEVMELDPVSGGIEEDKETDTLNTEEHDIVALDEALDHECLDNLSNSSNRIESDATFSEGTNDFKGSKSSVKEKDQNPPCIILEVADANGNSVKDVNSANSEEKSIRSKSPLTVQEWVDHLPMESEITEKDCNDPVVPKDLDNLVSNDNPPQEKKTIISQKLSREASIQSNSSLDSLLDSRRPDPVEVLLNLGFGGVPGVDMYNCRIPKRFLVPSKCKGGDWNEFLQRELLQAQNFECTSLGFRGLSGPSYRRPSAIVANIMEKLRERAAPRHPVKSRFSTVAKRVLNEKSVLNKLSGPPQSVLTPGNRKFLDNQGKISPEVPRRRIIFGQKSFAFANDGEFVEVEASSKVTKIPQKEFPLSVGSSSADSDLDEEKSEPAILPGPDVMLKIRRSSLQRQKKVEEESDAFDSNSPRESTEMSNKTKLKENYNLDDGYFQKDKKIPLRFVPTANLWQPVGEENSKKSEEIMLEVAEEIKTLTEKIQKATNVELSSILLQIKELRTTLEKSPGQSKDKE